jgi:large subunit ribosomal protein L17
MRHRKTVRKLGRTASHRHATLANLATALFEHKKIKTTAAKAKVLRSVAERLITFAKKGDVAARREVYRTVQNKDVVKILFDEIAPKFEERNGGYTRVVKLGQRNGDAAEVAFIELVGFEKVQKKKGAKTEKADHEKAKIAPVVAETEKAEPIVEETAAEPVPENAEDTGKIEK